MSFQFIDNSSVCDPSVNKKIRSHVMKGKNVGRKIVGRGRKHQPEAVGLADKTYPGNKAIRPDNSGTTLVRAAQNGPQEIASHAPEAPWNLFIGHEFEYFAFPSHLTPYMRYLLYEFNSAVCETVYPYAFCRPSREASIPWFEFMISSQAFFHCLLAMISSYVSFFHRPKPETLEGTHHLSQTFRLVQGELSQHQVPQDRTFAVVACLVVHANLLGDARKSRIHLDGLDRMVKLRPGGLAALRACNVALVHKVSGVDVDCALLNGTATRLGALVAEAPELILGPPIAGSAARTLYPPLNKLCIPLQCITKDTLALCRRPGKAKLDPFQYQDILISISQRLVDFAPLLGPRPISGLDDVWQLGLLCLIATIRYNTGFLRNLHCRLLKDVVRMRFSEAMLIAEGEGEREMHFWLYFMSALTMDQGFERLVFFAQLRQLAGELRLRDWRDARDCLQSLPWIGAVHDGPGEELWGFLDAH